MCPTLLSSPFAVLCCVMSVHTLTITQYTSPKYDLLKNMLRHSLVGNESYLQELCDTLGEVLVALDVQLQLIESGWQRR